MPRRSGHFFNVIAAFLLQADRNNEAQGNDSEDYRDVSVPPLVIPAKAWI